MEKIILFLCVICSIFLISKTIKFQELTLSVPSEYHKYFYIFIIVGSPDISGEKFRS